MIILFYNFGGDTHPLLHQQAKKKKSDCNALLHDMSLVLFPACLPKRTKPVCMMLDYLAPGLLNATARHFTSCWTHHCSDAHVEALTGMHREANTSTDSCPLWPYTSFPIHSQCCGCAPPFKMCWVDSSSLALCPLALRFLYTVYIVVHRI